MISNKFQVDNDIVIICLEKQNGEILETFVDKESFFEKVINLDVKWYAHYDPKMDGYYAVGYLRGTGRKGKKLKLHRVVTNVDEHLLVDHINHQTLDNRKKLQKNNSSGHRNVRYRKDSDKWQAYITIESKFKSLGSYSSKEEAVRVAEIARIEYLGEVV